LLEPAERVDRGVEQRISRRYAARSFARSREDVGEVVVVDDRIARGPDAERRLGGADDRGVALQSVDFDRLRLTSAASPRQQARQELARSRMWRRRLSLPLQHAVFIRRDCDQPIGLILDDPSGRERERETHVCVIETIALQYPLCATRTEGQPLDRSQVAFLARVRLMVVGVKFLRSLDDLTQALIVVRVRREYAVIDPRLALLFACTLDLE